jgi:hypothetical protein
MDGVSKAKTRRVLAFESMRRAEQAGEADGWQDRSRCVTEGLDAMTLFPEEPGPELARARQMCMGCPEASSCVAKALSLGSNCIGVWGGTTWADRRAYRSWLSKQRRKGAA